MTVCQAGRSKTALTPPPVDPPPRTDRSPGAFHHVTSSAGVPVSMVPPTLRTNGLVAGKFTCALWSSTWSPTPSSPDDTQVVRPSIDAACSRRLISWTAAPEKSGESSASPQLTDRATGRGLAAAAVLTRSIQPFWVNGAK